MSNNFSTRLEEINLQTKPAIKAHGLLKALLTDLDTVNLPAEAHSFIHNEIDQMNLIKEEGPRYKASLKTKTKILSHLSKVHKLSPQKYYQNQWMLLGMTVFGIPLGVAYGTFLKNMGMIGIGLPIGLGIGTFYGKTLDKKAFEEGRQLPFEVKNYF